MTNNKKHWICFKFNTTFTYILEQIAESYNTTLKDFIAAILATNIDTQINKNIFDIRTKTDRKNPETTYISLNINKEYAQILTLAANRINKSRQKFIAEIFTDCTLEHIREWFN